MRSGGDRSARSSRAVVSSVRLRVPSALLFALLLPLAGCAASPRVEAIPTHPEGVIPAFVISGRSASPLASPGYSLAGECAFAVPVSLWADKVTGALQQAGYPEQVGDPAAASTKPELCQVVLECGRVRICEGPSDLFWPNSVLWAVTWLPAEVVPDRNFTADVAVRCVITRDGKTLLDEAVPLKVHLTLSPWEYRAPWLGFLRFQVEGWSLRRHVMDQEQWAAVAARFHDPLTKALASQIAHLVVRAAQSDAAAVTSTVPPNCNRMESPP